MPTPSDWIALLEATYDLSGDLDAWLRGLLGAAAPVLDEGNGVAVQIFRLRPRGVTIERAGQRGPNQLAEMAVATVEAAGTDAHDLVYRSGIPAATMSEVVWSRLPAEEDAFIAATGGRFRDVIGIVAHTGTGSGLALNSPLETPRAMTAVERRRWTQVAAHVGAGLRLRRDLASRSPEAVLDADGRVLDAQGNARARDARERLRHAVLQMESARGAVRRRDPDEAMGLWEGLVGGRWSLVDRFDSDGRRFVVAHRNDPEVGDPRGLSRRERQVAEFAGFGRTPKEIAYVLGLSASAVANAEGRARAKLGLATRAELASFFAPGGLRRRLIEAELEGEPMLVAAAPLVIEERLAPLSPAEREVALLAAQGATNAAIGARRESAERTVANQMRAVFEKLGVHSRAELAAVLARAQGPAAEAGVPN